jgi:hypothetical protein
MIPDRFFYPLIVLVIAGLVALAVVFPQGEGEHSWGPFGYPTAAEQRAADQALRRLRLGGSEPAPTQAIHPAAAPPAAPAPAK